MQREETLLRRRYLAGVSHELRMHAAAKNLLEVLEEVVFFNIFWRLRDCIARWRRDSGTIPLSHRGGLERAGYLVNGCRWWSYTGEFARLENVCREMGPTLPVAVPDYVQVVLSVLLPTNSLATRVFKYRQPLVVSMRDQAVKAEERERRKYLRELRLRPGGAEAWWGNLAQGAYLRKYAELADSATLGAFWKEDSDEPREEDSDEPGGSESN